MLIDRSATTITDERYTQSSPIRLSEAPESLYRQAANCRLLQRAADHVRTGLCSNRGGYNYAVASRYPRKGRVARTRSRYEQGLHQTYPGQ